jgi:acyl transferase domain-containing protein
MATPQPSSPKREVAPLPYIVSAPDEAGLRRQAARLRAHVDSQSNLELTQLAYSLIATRTHFSHRAVVVARDHASVLSGFEAVARGECAANVVLGQCKPPGKLVFVFAGQGSQWPEMGRKLLDTSDIFRKKAEECDRALSAHLAWSPLSVLRGTTERPLERVDTVQPVLFLLMVSLATVWRAMGVAPDAVVGHSQGEVAAAYVAGALSLEDAAKLVALRSKALTRLSGKGAMAAVEMRAVDLEERFASFGQSLSIAAINGPHSTAISGDTQTLDSVLSELTESKVFARRIQADCAGHCPQVEELREELLTGLRGLSPRRTELPFYSSVTGAQLAGDTLDESYWFQNLRNTVLFERSVRTLLEHGHRYFVEVSPHPVLLPLLEEAMATRHISGAAVGSLRRGEGTLDRLRLSLGELYANGYPVDWSGIVPQAECVSLPTYQFHSQRYWPETPYGRASEAKSQAEREFWRAVERSDLERLVATLQLGDEAERTSLASILPALATFAQSATGPSRSVDPVNPVDAFLSTEPMNRQPRPPVPTAYVAPSTEIERVLAEAWSRVLGIREVGIHDDFFQLGGSSLVAGQILARVRATFPVQLRFDVVFHNPTIASLATRIEELLRMALDELPEEEVERLLASNNSSL